MSEANGNDTKPDKERLCRLREEIRATVVRGDRSYGIILAIDNGLRDEFVGRFETWWPRHDDETDDL